MEKEVPNIKTVEDQPAHNLKKLGLYENGENLTSDIFLYNRKYAKSILLFLNC